MTRMDIEKEEMNYLFPQFYLVNENGRFGWKGELKGFEFLIIYPSTYPTIGPVVYENPRIDTAHKINDGLCLWETREWNPNWTAATVVGFILRFLFERKQGLV